MIDRNIWVKILFYLKFDKREIYSFKCVCKLFNRIVLEISPKVLSAKGKWIYNPELPIRITWSEEYQKRYKVYPDGVMPIGIPLLIRSKVLFGDEN